MSSQHGMTDVAGAREQPAGAGLESRISEVGGHLSASLAAVLAALPGQPRGPAELARSLRLDKVLASRVLKALRHRDALAVVNLVPGPEPLRRLVRAAGRQGVAQNLTASADLAVDAFERLIRQEAGDRSALDAIISTWLPAAREEFELRRKQAAFKAMSQLKGVVAETSLATVLLGPSDDGENLDVVWITGLMGVHRLRPGAGVKFATRRFTVGDSPRRPTSLDGVPVDDLHVGRLDDFCSTPPPDLEATHVGDVVHYTLADNGFGPAAAADLVFAEVNLAEMPRYVPARQPRKGYVFAEVGTPVKVLHFDVFVHDDVYPGSEPVLMIYDTALDGVASVNDPSRDIDRLDLAESIQALGHGIAGARTADLPDYSNLLRSACERLRWRGDRFRCYRCRIDFPIYGSQVAMAFDPPAAPA